LTGIAPAGLPNPAIRGLDLAIQTELTHTMWEIHQITPLVQIDTLVASVI
jgi:hypothetical protein